MFKKRYGFKDYYLVLVLSHRALVRFMSNRIKKKMDPYFLERLMLAVTEVNGCEVCSYAHTNMALKMGMSQNEIDSFLSGSDYYVHPHEAKAILFAQHYADSLGRPTVEAYQSLKDTYGKEKSKIIVSAIQVMMLGNLIGLPLSAFLARLKGKPYQNSSLFYEVSMLLSTFIFLPLSIIHALIRWLIIRENIRFTK